MMSKLFALLFLIVLAYSEDEKIKIKIVGIFTDDTCKTPTDGTDAGGKLDKVKTFYTDADKEYTLTKEDATNKLTFTCDKLKLTQTIDKKDALTFEQNKCVEYTKYPGVTDPAKKVYAKFLWSGACTEVIKTKNPIVYQDKECKTEVKAAEQTDETKAWNKVLKEGEEIILGQTKDLFDSATLTLTCDKENQLKFAYQPKTGAVVEKQGEDATCIVISDTRSVKTSWTGACIKAEKTDDEGMGTGAIVGIVVGCVAGAALIGGLIYWFGCKQ